MAVRGTVKFVEVGGFRMLQHGKEMEIGRDGFE